MLKAGGSNPVRPWTQRPREPDDQQQCRTLLKLSPPPPKKKSLIGYFASISKNMGNQPLISGLLMLTLSGFSSPSPSAKGGISNPDRRRRWSSLAKPALGVALAIGVLAAGQAQAYQFNFSYNDSTNTANGVLVADLIGIDTYHITGGGLSVTGPNSGSYTIVPGGPGFFSIPDFTVDNVLYPAQDPVFDLYGIGLVNDSDSGIHLNIWGNSPGNYSFHVFSTSSNSYSEFDGPATVSATARVPGPLPALGAAAAFGFSRKLRKRIKINKGSSATFTLL